MYTYIIYLSIEKTLHLGNPDDTMTGQVFLPSMYCDLGYILPPSHRVGNVLEEPLAVVSCEEIELKRHPKRTVDKKQLAPKTSRNL